MNLMNQFNEKIYYNSLLEFLDVLLSFVRGVKKYTSSSRWVPQITGVLFFHFLTYNIKSNREFQRETSREIVYWMWTLILFDIQIFDIYFLRPKTHISLLIFYSVNKANSANFSYLYTWKILLTKMFFFKS